MPITIIVHVAGEEAVVGQLDELPGPTDNTLLVKKVRRRDGKPVHYLAPGVDTVIWPIDRLTFIEVVPSREERQAGEESRQPAPAESPPPAAQAGPPPAVQEPPAPVVAESAVEEPVEDTEAAPSRPAAGRLGNFLTQRRERQG